MRKPWEKPLNQANRKLRNLIDRGVLNRVSYDGRVRMMQVSPRENLTLDGLEHIEPYGFTSHPLPGCEVIVASLGGNRGRALVLTAHDARHQIVIAEGETAVFTHLGEKVHLRQDNSILVKAGTRVLLDTPLTQLTGDLDVGGSITCDGTIDSAGDQTAGGVSQMFHKTTGVVAGNDLSGGPQ